MMSTIVRLDEPPLDDDEDEDDMAPETSFAPVRFARLDALVVFTVCAVIGGLASAVLFLIADLFGP